MSQRTTRQARVQLAGMLLIAAATGVAFAVGESVRDGVQSFAIIAAFALLVHLGRGRSGTLEAMGGIGDERTTSHYTRAMAFTGSVLTFVLPGWWLVTVVRGEADQTLAALCLVGAVSFVGAAAWFARRG